MLKTMGYLFALALLINLSSLSFTQNSPAKTARQMKNGTSHYDTGVSSGCGICFAYGGDLDSNSAQANGLASEKDILISDSEVVWPMVIPPGHSATVNTLEANFLTLACVADPQQADWDVRTGVSSGNGGTVLAAGTNSIGITATGRSAFGLIECRVSVTLPSALDLSAGTYFFGVVPYCTNSNNNTCLGQRYFLSDSPDQPPLNGKHYPQPDNSFINSGSFGLTWAPTWGSSGECAGVGCQRFSAGLAGTPN